MTDTPPPPPSRPSTSVEANDFFSRGAALKAAGQYSAALTEFRRAVIADPAFFSALMEIGKLSRDRAKTDRLFLRYAYDALRQAAALDLDNAEAHDQYIVVSQEMGQMEALHAQYDAWSKANPDNTNLQRCYKNILTLSMAMMPDRVTLADSKASATLRKFLLFASIGGMVAGLAMIILPTIFVRSGKLSKESAAAFMKVGMALGVLSLGGLVVTTRLK